jgi:hypothetical protein
MTLGFAAFEFPNPLRDQEALCNTWHYSWATSIKRNKSSRHALN